MRDPQKYLRWSVVANILQAGILVAALAYGGKVLGDIQEDQKLYQEFMIEQAGLNGAYTYFMENNK